MFVLINQGCVPAVCICRNLRDAMCNKCANPNFDVSVIVSGLNGQGGTEGVVLRFMKRKGSQVTKYYIR